MKELKWQGEKEKEERVRNISRFLAADLIKIRGKETSERESESVSSGNKLSESGYGTLNLSNNFKKQIKKSRN